MPRDTLGPFEQIVMLAIMRLKENAYGISIRDEIGIRTSKKPSVGALYATLERLEQKGFVKPRTGEATPQRGGKPKKFFRLTGSGQLALNAALSQTDAMRSGLVIGGKEVTA